jgi:hypothetical protein
VISVHGLGVLLYAGRTSTEMRKRSTHGETWDMQLTGLIGFVSMTSW